MLKWGPYILTSELWLNSLQQSTNRASRHEASVFIGNGTLENTLLNILNRFILKNYKS